MEEPLPFTTVHTENEEHPLSRKAALTLTKGATHNGGIAVIGQEVDVDEAACNRWVVKHLRVYTFADFSIYRSEICLMISNLNSFVFELF